MQNKTSKKTKKSDNWYYEFTELSSLSPNGQYTVKSGDVGLPICVIPMPIGGVKTKQKQEAKARKISSVNDLLEALEKVTSDLFYQIESKHGAKAASEYLSIIEAKAAIAKAKIEE